MPRFAAALNMLYQEHAPLARFEAAAADGFRGVEVQFPYALAAEDIAARLAAHTLELVLINTPAGDPERNERGLAALPGREDAFRAAIDEAARYADALKCPRIHVMAGVLPAGVSREHALDVYLTNLAWALNATPAEVTLLIEPINPRDLPGYLLNRQDEAHTIVQALGSPRLKVQMDLYHCQIVEGDLEARLRHYLPGGRVGHLQIAGVPARHEPDGGEVNYPHLFRVIDELGWDGWVGCEYRPAAGTSAGLGWLRALG